MYDVPMYLLCLAAGLGSFSHAWGRLSFLTFICASIYLLAHHTVLSNWSFGLNYIGYFGAIMSCAFGVLITKNIRIHADVDFKIKQRILWTAIAISALYFVQVIMDFGNQLVFNIGLPEDNFIHSIFQGTVFVIKSLQVLLLREGGVDGGKRIGSYTYNHLWGDNTLAWDTKTTHSIQKEREEI